MFFELSIFIKKEDISSHNKHNQMVKLRGYLSHFLIALSLKPTYYTLSASKSYTKYKLSDNRNYRNLNNGSMKCKHMALPGIITIYLKMLWYV